MPLTTYPFVDLYISATGVSSTSVVLFVHVVLRVFPAVPIALSIALVVIVTRTDVRAIPSTIAASHLVTHIRAHLPFAFFVDD